MSESCTVPPAPGPSPPLCSPTRIDLLQSLNNARKYNSSLPSLDHRRSNPPPRYLLPRRPWLLTPPGYSWTIVHLPGRWTTPPQPHHPRTSTDLKRPTPIMEEPYSTSHRPYEYDAHTPILYNRTQRTTPPEHRTTLHTRLLPRSLTLIASYTTRATTVV